MCPQLGMRERFSSLTKFVSATANVQRFCHSARYANEKQTGHFKALDLQAALYACIYMVQHIFCQGEIAILRRVRNASSEGKCQESLIAI